MASERKGVIAAAREIVAARYFDGDVVLLLGGRVRGEMRAPSAWYGEGV
jgi:hypothetical protein